MNDGTPSGPPKKSYAAIVAVAAFAAIAGFAAVYGTVGQPDNTGISSPEAAAPAEGTRKRVPGLPAFVFKAAPEPLADVTFNDASGAAKTLKDFQGRTILLNLWATWCAPCREEMPSLDRLQTELGSDKFEVVALAVDRTGPEAAQKFLDSVNVKALKLYTDTTTRSGSALKAVGMPVTILIDPQGREVGRLTGPAEWDSEAAKQFIRTSLAEAAASR
jgi:thiol-disulfide isomerase/thioredoxin